jgi:hypothetical protein
MAKKSKAFSETKAVVINSGTYGRHRRAARGSQTRAVVNDAFAAQANKTKRLNAAGKAAYDVLKLYSNNFREGNYGRLFKPYAQSKKC